VMATKNQINQLCDHATPSTPRIVFRRGLLIAPLPYSTLNTLDSSQGKMVSNFLKTVLAKRSRAQQNSMHE
jgi:hypothetical protein